VLLSQCQPLGKTLFKFGVDHGLFLPGSSLWDRGHTIARSSEQFAEAKNAKAICRRSGESA